MSGGSDGNERNGGKFIIYFLHFLLYLIILFGSHKLDG